MSLLCLRDYEEFETFSRPSDILIAEDVIKFEQLHQVNKSHKE